MRTVQICSLIFFKYGNLHSQGHQWLCFCEKSYFFWQFNCVQRFDIGAIAVPSPLHCHITSTKMDITTNIHLVWKWQPLIKHTVDIPSISLVTVTSAIYTRHCTHSKHEGFHMALYPTCSDIPFRKICLTPELQLLDAFDPSSEGENEAEPANCINSVILLHQLWLWQGLSLLDCITQPLRMLPKFQKVTTQHSSILTSWDCSAYYMPIGSSENIYYTNNRWTRFLMMFLPHTKEKAVDYRNHNFNHWHCSWYVRVKAQYPGTKIQTRYF